jgi:hypothetical protein
MLALSSAPMRVVKMKSAISLTLIVCLMASALPLTAQAQMEGAVDLVTEHHMRWRDCDSCRQLQHESRDVGASVWRLLLPRIVQ